MESLERLQHLQQRELRKMEKIDLAGGQSRIVKLTGWTIVVGMNAVFRVEKIDA